MSARFSISLSLSSTRTTSIQLYIGGAHRIGIIEYLFEFHANASVCIWHLAACNFRVANFLLSAKKISSLLNVSFIYKVACYPQCYTWKEERQQSSHTGASWVVVIVFVAIGISITKLVCEFGVCFFLPRLL